MTYLPRFGRRRLLGLLATVPVLLRAGEPKAAPARAADPTPLAPVAAAPFPEGARLLVAGPDNGALNHWADAVLPPLEQSLPPDSSVRRVVVGGPDGVTGANQFEARGAPDGFTVLLVPGQAVLAWMVGDPRAQFDVGHWVPVMAGVTPGLIAGRQAALAPNGRIRIAAAGPASLDLPALLGCDLLGARPEPVSGLTDLGAARNAFAQGAVDAVFLRGHGVRGAVRGARIGGRSRSCSPWARPTSRDTRCAIRSCRTYRIWPNSTRHAPAAAGRPAVQCLVRSRRGRAAGIRAGPAAAHACGDGVAVAARRRGGDGGHRCPDGRDLARRASARWACRHRQHRRGCRAFGGIA